MNQHHGHEQKRVTGDRSAYLAQLCEPGRNWDLIVIGGGASGLGIALEAVSRGYSVLLLERFDFAKGTSSRSTKLVHGGVRYLAQGNIGLVREASIERGILHRNAAHLVRNQVFLVPVFTGWERLKYTIGLKLYDWIAGGLSLGASEFVSRGETLRLLPGIRSAGLKGAVKYHDGQFDDARLAINLAQTIWELGGDAINYMEVTGINRNDSGEINGVMVRDSETGSSLYFKSPLIINATGVFVDGILRMANDTHIDTVRVSQGVHLVLDKKFMPSSEALMIPETSDGRVLFVVPWHDKLVLGTTDTPVQNYSVEPVALEQEISFILDTAAQYLEKKPAREDVLSVFAGLRPLAAPTGKKEKTKEISRSHKILLGASGIYTMLGGKWTTYRKMGEDMINRIEQTKGWKKTKSVTSRLSIHGNNGTVVEKNDHNFSKGISGTLGESRSQNKSYDDDPLYWYGSDRENIETMIRNSGKDWISIRFGIHEETIRWSVRFEMARTVEDILARRTRVLFLDVREAGLLALPVATVLSVLLDKDQLWINNEVEEFRKLCGFYLPRPVV
ncbi:MAG: glycerol-3-phosphate dehydrogenase/oxidase [Chitinophagaceae bacterium]